MIAASPQGNQQCPSIRIRSHWCLLDSVQCARHRHRPQLMPQKPVARAEETAINEIQRIEMDAIVKCHVKNPWKSMEGHIWNPSAWNPCSNKNDNVYCCITSIHGVFPLVLWVHKKGQLSTTSLSLLANLCKVLGHVALGDVICFFEGTPEKKWTSNFFLSHFRIIFKLNLIQVYQYIIFGLDVSSISRKKNAGHFMRHQLHPVLLGKNPTLRELI